MNRAGEWRGKSEAGMIEWWRVSWRMRGLSCRRGTILQGLQKLIGVLTEGAPLLQFPAQRLDFLRHHPAHPVACEINPGPRDGKAFGYVVSAQALHGTELEDLNIAGTNHFLHPAQSTVQQVLPPFAFPRFAKVIGHRGAGFGVHLFFRHFFAPRGIAGLSGQEIGDMIPGDAGQPCLE